MSVEISACAYCAKKMAEAYNLVKVRETGGKCQWCQVAYGSLGVYEYTPLADKEKKARRSHQQTGGGERNRQYDD